MVVCEVQAGVDTVMGLPAGVPPWHGVYSYSLFVLVWLLAVNWWHFKTQLNADTFEMCQCKLRCLAYCRAYF